ncbi:SDR family oxidoreductase [Caballeronia sp. AZ7_KS35]|uniref:SDR family oxidoreductase n=1 Tax=Caballeronia sp. AZ7_KS35 TaxID=2921762 RepID=UPI002029724A|nr:SDR family oxidoreductase [Caballeronia sp. AZ7_KS35]
MKKIVIVGATSAIAIACTREWAAQGARFFLVARNQERMEQVAADVNARGAASVAVYRLDIDRLDDHAAMLADCAARMDSIDIVLIVSGTLPDQAVCQSDPAVAVREFHTNALSLIALLTPLVNRLEAQRHGTLAVISSVAGDRGRPSNYLYGSAKAALQAFLEGLRARLFKVGAHVVDIRPRFVATPMTAGLPLPGPLVATPEKVAKDIVRAVARKKDVLYTPWFWWGIMFVIRNVPRFAFKWASL